MKTLKSLTVVTIVLLVSLFLGIGVFGDTIPVKEFKDEINDIKSSKTYSSLEKPKNFKVYSSTEARLIEWTKVPHAKQYIIYRKKGTNSSKSKYAKIATVNETYFYNEKYDYCSDHIDHKRWYIDIYYKKKNKCKYNQKYTYKIVAVRGNTKSGATTKYSGKVKKPCTNKKNKKKIEPSYYGLYLTNKMRVKKGKIPIPWGHKLEKGSKQRVKDLTKKYSHDRPDKTSYVTAFGYARYFEPELCTFCSAGIFGEDIASGSSTKGNYIDYKNSPAHYGLLLLSSKVSNCTSKIYGSNEKAFAYTGIAFCSYQRGARPKLVDGSVKNETVIGTSDGYCVSTKYTKKNSKGKTVVIKNESEAKKKDRTLSISQKLKNYSLRNVSLENILGVRDMIEGPYNALQTKENPWFKTTLRQSVKGGYTTYQGQYPDYWKESALQELDKIEKDPFYNYSYVHHCNGTPVLLTADEFYHPSHSDKTIQKIDEKTGVTTYYCKECSKDFQRTSNTDFDNGNLTVWNTLYIRLKKIVLNQYAGGTKYKIP